MLAAAGVAVAGALGGWWSGEPHAAPEPDPSPALDASQPQDTLLLVRESGDGGPANGVTLLAATPGEEPGVVLFLPVGVLVDVPGVGVERLARAHRFGGAALVRASVENALGIQIDHAMTVDDEGLGSLLERTGGLPVHVDEQLVRRSGDGSVRVAFEAGSQILDGARLAEYWSFRSRSEDELAALPRQQEVLAGLLAATAEEPGLAVELFAEPLPVDTDADPGWLADVLTALAADRAADRLSFTLLPVEPFSGDDRDTATYRPRDDAVDALVAGSLAGSVPDADGAVVRLQVLNGVGVPGVGEEVDRRLDGERFRLVRTGNASSFDFAETLVLVYDEEPASLAAARRVQERLGVGTIRVSRQTQSIVDLTIVVGADFLDEEQRT